MLRINSLAASAQQAAGLPVELPFPGATAPTRDISGDRFGCECHPFSDFELADPPHSVIGDGYAEGSATQSFEEPRQQTSQQVTQYERLPILGDGRCSIRSVLLGFGAEALANLGMPMPPSMDVANSDDQVALTYLRDVRVAAVTALRRQVTGALRPAHPLTCVLCFDVS